MLIDDLHKKKKIIEKLALKHGAKKIWVFGSVARREEGPNSDIDFLVDFPPGYDLFKQRIPLARKLSDLTGRVVDLVPKHELNQHLKKSVIKESVSL